MKFLRYFLCCALMSGQTPEARSHFKNAQGLFEEHDDTGDALAEAEREFRLRLEAGSELRRGASLFGAHRTRERGRKGEGQADFETALRINANCRRGASRSDSIGH